MNKTTIFDKFIGKIGVVSKEKISELNINTIEEFSEIKFKDICKLDLNPTAIKNLIDFYSNFYEVYSSKNASPRFKVHIIDIFFEKLSNTKVKNIPKRNQVVPIIKKNCHSPFHNLKKKLSLTTTPLFDFSFETLQNDNKIRGLKKSTLNKLTKNKNILKYNRKILVSFGISDYLEWNKLVNPNNDVEALSNFAQQKLGFSQICTYTDKVTKNKMEKIITHDLYQITNCNDLVVMSFHGHGHNLSFNSKDEGFIVPYDAPKNPTPFHLISMSDLSRWFRYIKARHILILLDCCFSGMSVLRNDNEKIHKDLDITAISTNLKSSSKIIINAGTSYQSVSDGGWGNNSIFTGSIISCPIFNNTVGSVMNLYYYLLQTIPRYSNQTPSIGKLQGDMGTDIFLSL